MPIYEYKCQSCGHQFEKIVRLNESPECPACESKELEKLLSTPGISTQKTRSRSMSEARRRGAAIKKEKDHAQAEYERNYIRDHS